MPTRGAVRLGALALACVFSLAFPRPASASGVPDYMIDMIALEVALDEYRERYGVFPVSTAEATWLETLLASDVGPLSLQKHGAERMVDGRLVARHGGEIAYTPPDPLSAPSGTVRVQGLLRWTGPDGVDDHGERDDVRLGFGPNPGYHWKRHWPLARRLALMLAFVLPLWVWFVWVIGGRRVVRTIAWTAMCGVAVMAITDVLMYPGRRVANGGSLGALGVAVVFGTIVYEIALCSVGGVNSKTDS